MKTTKFTLFKNHPITDYQNTIHFTSNQARDDWHLNQSHVSRLNFTEKFNYLRDRGILRVNHDTGIHYLDLVGVNYCTFVTDFEPDTRYYAYVNDITYINDNVTELGILIDPVMTFTQGSILSNIQSMTVERQHLPFQIYNAMMPWIKTNLDILNTTSKHYVYQNAHIFEELWVIFTCAQNLESDFGEEGAPDLETSSGSEYDRVVSPLNIYACEKRFFTGIMEQLAPFPWKSQAIKKVIQIPEYFLKLDDLEDAKINNKVNNALKKFKNGSTSGFLAEISPNLSLSIDDLYDIHGLDPVQDKHLLRSEYTTIEYYSWDGKSMSLDPAFLPLDGAQIGVQTCVGYHNEIAFFPVNYKTDTTREPIVNSDGYPLYRGTYLNDAIIFDSFDEIPVLVDNTILARAQTANRRALNEERQISNRLQNIVAPDTSLKDRFFDAASVLSGGLRPTAILGKFSDEYEFYRSQKAEFADLEIETPTLTQQSNSSSYQIANQIYGVTLKVASLDAVEWLKIRRYYKAFGFEMNDQYAQTYNIQSMSVMNYLKASGSWVIPNVDVNLMEQLRVTIENGVAFWHNDGSDNPLKRNILDNIIVANT